MCVIIHKPAGIEFPENDIRAAYHRNNDGFGYMWYNKDTGRVVTKKGVNWSVEKVLQKFKELKDVEACFHFRMKTHGEVVSAQAHPFKVLDKKLHGMDMYFMHNGVIRDAGIVNEESDTQAFNWNILQPMFRTAPALINTEAARKVIESFISTGSKLCFMFDDGKVVKYNESQGSERAGCWVSNTYSFAAPTNFHSHHRGGHRQNGSYTPSSTATSTAVMTPSERKVKLMDGDVGVGDDVYVYKETDPNFFSEGVITQINVNSVIVAFKNEKGVDDRSTFWLSDGESLGMQNYSIIPAKAWIDAVEAEDLTLRVRDLKEEEVTVEKKEEAATSPEEELSVITNETPIEESLIVTHKGHSVDAYSRWGGSFVDDSLTDYSGKTILDVHNMDFQKRFEYFLDNLEDSFAMFNDLVDRLVIEDIENDILDDAEEEEYACYGTC